MLWAAVWLSTVPSQTQRPMSLHSQPVVMFVRNFGPAMQLLRERAYLRVSHPSMPQHVVQSNQTASSHKLQAALIVPAILPFVSICTAAGQIADSGHGRILCKHRFGLYALTDECKVIAACSILLQKGVQRVCRWLNVSGDLRRPQIVNDSV